MSVISKFMTRFSNDRKLRRIILIAAAAAVLLLVLSELLGGAGKTGEDITADKYAQQLGKNLTALVNKVEGAGKAEVIVTLDYGNQSASKSVFFSSVSAAAEYPPVCGVLILCEGGADPIVAERITKAVSVALNIGYNDIYIIELNGDLEGKI